MGRAENWAYCCPEGTRRKQSGPSCRVEVWRLGGLTQPLFQEIFGPVLTVYVYPDDKYKETLQLVDNTTSYGLTGAVFAQDK